MGNNFSRVGGVWDDLSALGGGCEYRQSFPDSAAAHVLLCGPVLNRPVSGSGAGDPCRKVGIEWSSILAWETHGQRSLEGYSPWGCRELDTTSDLLRTQDIAHKSAWVSTFPPCGSHDEVVNGGGEKKQNMIGHTWLDPRWDVEKNGGYQIKYHSKPIIRSK